MNVTLHLNPRRIVRQLAFFAVGFVLAGVVSHIFKYGFGLLPELFRWFNVDGEKNFPSAFSTVLLLLCATLLLFITVAKQTAQDPFARHWAGLVGVFSLLATDEWLSCHEKIGGMIKTKLPTSGIFHFTWIIVGIAFVSLIGLIYVRFLLQLPKRYRRLFLRAACLFVLGSIGMEMIAGYYTDQHEQWSRTIWLVMTTLEEGLEMVGILTFIYALLTYVQDFMGELKIDMMPSSETSSTGMALLSIGQMSKSSQSHRSQ